jgi:hypothetical protein
MAKEQRRVKILRQYLPEGAQIDVIEGHDVAGFPVYITIGIDAEAYNATMAMHYTAVKSKLMMLEALKHEHEHEAKTILQGMQPDQTEKVAAQAPTETPRPMEHPDLTKATDTPNNSPPAAKISGASTQQGLQYSGSQRGGGGRC